MASGGFRVGAGRPRKSDAEKELAGRAVKSSNTRAVNKAVGNPKVVPSDLMDNYFAMALKECAAELPSVESLRTEIDSYIENMGCTGMIAPQIVTDYIIHRQGYLACEAMNRKVGRMTKDMKLSPYVSASQGYYKNMRDDFNLILQIVQRYGGGHQQQEENEFLNLLMNRGF
jgi:hypothetical protein